MDFKTLLSDYNGSVLLEPGTSEWGYVEQQWFLQVPFDSKDLNKLKFSDNVDPFDANINFENFIRANYVVLSSANALGNNEKALFGAMLRAHCVKNKMFDMSKDTRCVIEDEYAIYEPTDKDWKQAIVPDINTKREIASFVKKYGDTLVQMMVYVFCSRGHHWQDDFDGLYDKLMKACSIVKPVGWTLPDNRQIFRQILHCFGVHLPLLYTEWCRSNNRMSNPMRLRFTPHAPVAGAAQITTLSATLREMQTEGWWTAFYARFGDSVDAIDAEVLAINKTPYEYHVASRVVTGKPKKDVSENGTVAFKALSQLALGYIDHLGRKHSLSSQKVITQKSGGIKPSGEAFSKACDKFGKPDTDVADMAKFLSQY